MENKEVPNDLKIGEGFCIKCGWRGNIFNLQNHICINSCKKSNALEDLIKGIKLIWDKSHQ